MMGSGDSKVEKPHVCNISSTLLCYISWPYTAGPIQTIGMVTAAIPVGFLASILILVVSDQILIIAVIIIPSQTEEASALRMRAQPPFVQASHQCQPLTELFGNLDHHHCHRRCRHSWRLIRRIRIPGGITTGRTTLSWMIDSTRQSSH